jgi:signal transduction histidine kinase
MTPTTIPVEEQVRQALDRLAGLERRLDALEAAALRPAEPPRVSSPFTETPPELPWPRRTATSDPVTPFPDPPSRVRSELFGRLVAGVAHDFSNLLTVILGSAEEIRLAAPAGSPLAAAADAILSTSQTAANLTRQLIGFARARPSEPCPVDPNAAVRGLERVLARLAGGGVKLDLTLAPAAPVIRADPGQFDQLLLNLVVNARDAVRGAGTVSVRTAAATVVPGRPGWPAGVPAGEFLALTVSDTGVGMTDEVKARVFEPYFTTKGDRGTGLGLAIVWDVVTGAGGHVEVESAPGWGTSVRVFWPALAGPARR